MTILVRESTWEKIRAQFSEPEKVALRSSVCSEVVCPRAFIIDGHNISKALRDKLLNVMESEDEA
jgi:hypothetical protein